MGFYEWARRLDDRIAVPLDRKLTRPWMRSRLGRLGVSAAVVFGGGLLVRVVFRHQFHTATWAVVVYAVLGLTGLVLALLARRREARTDREAP